MLWLRMLLQVYLQNYLITDPNKILYTWSFTNNRFKWIWNECSWVDLFVEILAQTAINVISTYTKNSFSWFSTSGGKFQYLSAPWDGSVRVCIYWIVTVSAIELLCPIRSLSDKSNIALFGEIYTCAHCLLTDTILSAVLCVHSIKILLTPRAHIPITKIPLYIWLVPTCTDMNRILYQTEIILFHSRNYRLKY